MFSTTQVITPKSPIQSTNQLTSQQGTSHPTSPQILNVSGMSLKSMSPSSVPSAFHLNCQHSSPSPKSPVSPVSPSFVSRAVVCARKLSQPAESQTNSGGEANNSVTSVPLRNSPPKEIGKSQLPVKMDITSSVIRSNSQDINNSSSLSESPPSTQIGPSGISPSSRSQLRMSRSPSPSKIPIRASSVQGMDS